MTAVLVRKPASGEKISKQVVRLQDNLVLKCLENLISPLCSPTVENLNGLIDH